MKKKFIPVLSVISSFIVIIVCVLAVFVSQISPVANNTEESDVRFEISYGTSVYTIAQNLQQEGLIKNGKFFYYAIRYPKILKFLYPKEKINLPIELKSGIYYVGAGKTYPQLITLLSSGQQEYTKVSIPEGLTITQIAALLEENKICSSTDFVNSCHKTVKLDEYGITGNSLEGFLFPDTYYLNSGMNSDSVVDLMVENFMDKIQTIPQLQSKSFKEIYDTVILASIVEREYRVEEEAPLIASVFTNRLKRNIGLYSCATIVYILTEIEGRPHPDRILIEDTKIDSPYNTYKWAGLTPGPISNPGLVALKAAANPPKTNYYFFQVVDAQQGRHVFTTTFDEHVTSHNLVTKK